MGKKSSSKNAYTSKGERKSVAQSTLKAMQRSKSDVEKLQNIQDAWLKGKNPWVTIANPNRQETNKKFIRVRANDLYMSPKEREKRNFVMK